MKRFALVLVALVAANTAFAAAKRKSVAKTAPVVTAIATPMVATTAAAAAPVSRPTPMPAKVAGPVFDAKAAISLAVFPDKTVNGGIAVAKVDGLVAGDVVTGSFNGMLLPVTAAEGSATFLVPVDLAVAPGSYPVTCRVRRAGKTIAKSVPVAVTDAKYEVQNLKLPKEKVDGFDAKTLARIERELHELSSIWPEWRTPRLWSGKFIKPLPGEWSELFGGKRVINGDARAPHSGIDQRGKEGTPIKAINAGRVVYIGDQFFTGNNVVIDHGQGVFSMYCHLSKIRAALGQSVAKGETIGLVGHTGRATGPHLHWGVRVAGARVDPQRLLALELPDTPGAPPMVVGTSEIPDASGEGMLPTEALPAAIAASNAAGSPSSVAPAK